MLVVLIGALKPHRIVRLHRSGIVEADRMDGRTFEEFLALMFRRLGYGAELTPTTGDYGADLVVTKNRVCQVVQVKRSNRPIGVKAVQEIAGARPYYRAQKALVITNRTFTPQACRLAKAADVELWDRSVLVEKLTAARRDGHLSHDTSVIETAPGAPMIESEPAPPAQVEDDSARCAICGKAVSAKVREYCLTQPRRFDANVYCFTHQRAMRA